MRKILLIASDPAIRTMTTDILALAHYEVLLAQDGKNGVELAETEHPDVIITEVAMPGLDQNPKLWDKLTTIANSSSNQSSMTPATISQNTSTRTRRKSTSSER